MEQRSLTHAFVLALVLIFTPSADAREWSSIANYERLLRPAVLQLEVNPTQELLEEVLGQIRTAITIEEHAQTLALISQRIGELEEHVSDVRFSVVVSFLLEHGFESAATTFLKAAEQPGSDYSLATIRLAFAHHYTQQKRWDDALLQLSQIAINTMLAPVDADHANLLYGLSMQGQKRHREAVEYYQRIEPDSPHYWLAQLNTALAYIRQDWWTDAQLAIERALPPDTQLADDRSDRLYTVLGYSQIQYGFYRRARNSFRQVRVDGPFANRALLGLGIAALHQEDVVGAINAFDHLKIGNANDISVAESYLLSAFASAQVGRTTSASAAYAEAIAFYQAYLTRLEATVGQIRQNAEQPFTSFDNPADLFIFMSQEDAAALMLWHHRLQLLEHVRSGIKNEQTRGNLLTLIKEVNSFTRELALGALDVRRRIIESYLNQANFGLAALYDSH